MGSTSTVLPNVQEMSRIGKRLIQLRFFCPEFWLWDVLWEDTSYLTVNAEPRLVLSDAGKICTKRPSRGMLISGTYRLAYSAYIPSCSMALGNHYLVTSVRGRLRERESTRTGRLRNEGWGFLVHDLQFSSFGKLITRHALDDCCDYMVLVCIEDGLNGLILPWGNSHLASREEGRRDVILYLPMTTTR